MGLTGASWNKYDVCISGEVILHQRKYKHLVLSAIEHADDMHLYYNMVSFLIKGRTLEQRWGGTLDIYIHTLMNVVFCCQEVTWPLTCILLYWFIYFYMLIFSFYINFNTDFFQVRLIKIHYPSSGLHFINKSDLCWTFLVSSRIFWRLFIHEELCYWIFRWEVVFPRAIQHILYQFFVDM